MQHSYILDFLEDWPTDESLSSPFVNNIKNGRFVDGSLHYLPNENITFADFWIQNIASYIHFFVYSMMQKWSSETSSELVKKRAAAYVYHFMDEIVEEMELLLLLTDTQSIDIVIKEHVEHSINTFLDEFKCNDLLLVTLCKNKEAGLINQKYFILLCHHIEIMKPQTALVFLSDFLSSHIPNEYNTILGKSILTKMVEKLSESYPNSNFGNIAKLNDNSGNWEENISQLKETASNTLKYYAGSKFSIDGITLGFTKYKEAEIIKNKNNVEDGSYTYDCMNYKGTSITFEYEYGDEENGKCCGFHLYNGNSGDDCKSSLNFFLGILFNRQNIDYRILSYNDFLILLENRKFFELQKFHKSRKGSNYYKAQWRQVNPSHICDFIFSIDGQEGMDEEQVKNVTNISIQLDIYINDSDNQEELYKTIPPELDSYDCGTDSSDYDFGLLKDNEPWFYVP